MPSLNVSSSLGRMAISNSALASKKCSLLNPLREHDVGRARSLQHGGLATSHACQRPGVSPSEHGIVSCDTLSTFYSMDVVESPTCATFGFSRNLCPYRGSPVEKAQNKLRVRSGNVKVVLCLMVAGSMLAVALS